MCGNRQSQMTFPKSKTLLDLITHLQQHSDYQFQKPRLGERERERERKKERTHAGNLILCSLRESRRSLYMFEPPSLEESLRPNLSVPVGDLFDSGTQLTICDPAIGQSFLLLTVHFE